jgi:hypothetical protein
MDYKKIQDFNEISHRQAVEKIIETNGECLSVLMCLSCPFAEKCIFRALEGGGLLNIDDRLDYARSFLFDISVEDELE